MTRQQVVSRLQSLYDNADTLIDMLALKIAIRELRGLAKPKRRKK